MKRIIFSIVLVTCFLQGSGQQDYFIFIQETSGQPFYVRIGDKSYSSSAGGHIILSKLQDSVYKLFVGFPMNKSPEQEFTVPVKKKDRGFELKNLNGIWELFDLQTMEFIKPVAAVIKEPGSLQIKKTDSYSELMAGVVNDTAVLYEIADTALVVKKRDSVEITVRDAVTTPDTGLVRTDKKAAKDIPETSDSIVQTGKDSVVMNKASVAKAKKAAALKKKQEAKAAAVVQPVETLPVAAVNTPARKPSPGAIRRYSTENTAEGKLIIYIDRSGLVPDTISLIIPRL